MKHLAIFSVFTISVLMSACRHPTLLEGTYCTTASSDFAGTNYYFRSDSTFTSGGWTCMSSDTGYGHYKLTRDSLILYYDTMEAEKASRIIIDTLPSGGDSCELQFYLHDNVGPLINAIVIVGTAKGSVIGKVTDMDGRTAVKVPWDEFPVTISCRYVGYFPVRSTIDSAINLKLAIGMIPSMKHITPGGTVHAYGLRKIKRKKILLTWDYIDEAGEKRIVKQTLYKKTFTTNR